MIDDRFTSPQAKIVLKRAIEFFGNQELAWEFFFRKVPTLGHNRPYDLLDNLESCQEILDVFARVEDQGY